MLSLNVIETVKFSIVSIIIEHVKESAKQVASLNADTHKNVIVCYKTVFLLQSVYFQYQKMSIAHPPLHIILIQIC